MDYRVDEKGKVFTAHVSKRSVAIIAQVRDVVIHGTLYLTLDNRLKDELNDGEKFLAVTDAAIHDLQSDRVLHTAPIIVVNKEHIAWILPTESAPAEPTAD